MKHLYIKRFIYKGYTVNIYTSNTATVVCKKLKRHYIPFYTREQCERCIDNIVDETKKEETLITWTYKRLKRAIELEMENK